MKRLLVICFLLIASRQYAQLVANAGNDRTECIGTPVFIGGSPAASGGTAPYSYSWQPSTGLSASNIPNPTANVTGWVNYTLTVTDHLGNTATDNVWVNLDDMSHYDAGQDTGYCFGQQGGPALGNPTNDATFHQFDWQPAAGLNFSNIPRPVATPTVTTTYTLTISDNNSACPNKICYVTVTPWQPPYASAGSDTTIDEGATITLHGIGATQFWWTPNYNIKYPGTKDPDVWPVHTTTYYMGTTNSHGCYSGDSVVVTVRPGDKLFFYSAFTPNNDGDNDVFYIGNVEKYPDNILKIYNRYDKVVFSANNYTNTWDGSYLGNPVPTGTYFYIFDDGKGNKYKGLVTIIR